MNRTVLLTRPLIAAEQDAQSWEQAGFAPLIAPLLKIEFVFQPFPDLRDYQAIVTTSATAIQALSKLTETRKVPLWCVGKASACLAKNLRFQKVLTPLVGELENATTLLRALLQNLHPKKGRIFYAAGEFVHSDLSIALREHGYEVEKRVLYRAHPTPDSWPKIRSFLEKPAIGGMTFYSQRTASIFKDSMNSEPDLKIKGEWYPLCLSPSIAAVIQPFFPRASIIASTTEQFIAHLTQWTSF